MYPKSPFKAGSQHSLFTNIRDDVILQFNTDLITSSHDKCVFLKIQGHVNKINEQLYNLRISNKYADNCTTDDISTPQIKSVITKLNVIKQTMRVKAKTIMKKYAIEKEVIRNVSSTTYKDQYAEIQYGKEQ